METAFTKRAAEHRLYLFRLLEPTGEPHPFRVTRNGESLQMTGELSLLLPPQELTKEHHARSSVQQTPHGYWVDDFGMGLPKWTLRGTMGFHAKSGFGTIGPSSVLDGYSGYHAFTDLIEEYFNENRRRAASAATGQGLQGLLRLEFIDTYDDDVWVIQPEGLPTKQRSISHNPIIRYDFKFTGLEDLRVRPASRKQRDPIGAALFGGAARQAAIAKAIEAHKATVQNDLDALAELERTDPGQLSVLQELMGCANTVQFSESAPGMQQRDSLLGLAVDTETNLADALSTAKAAGPVSLSLENAVRSSIQSSRILGAGSSCATRTQLGQLRADWASNLSSIAGAVSGGAGDTSFLSAFTPASIANLTQKGTNAVTILQGIASGDVSNVPAFGTASSYLSNLIAPVASLGSQVLNVATGVKGSIDLGLKTVQTTVDRMRRGLYTVQAALYQLRVFSNAARRLRALKRSLTSYMCAIQSILAFPYLFVRDLKEGLQSLLDLFQLSGCATSFPNLQGLSWEPNIQLPRVILP